MWSDDPDDAVSNTEADNMREGWEARWEKLYPDMGLVLPHEPFDEYRSGGYHPVARRDFLHDGRYLVRLKLGHGGFSTVWMAMDTFTNEWVSIKIKKADASVDDPNTDKEVETLRELERQYTTRNNRPQRRCFARLLDCFNLKGPNGRHTCLVTELLGPSLDSIRLRYALRGEIFEPEMILRASQQIIDGVDFAHSAGIVHGDVSMNNVVFTCKYGLDGDEEDVIEMMGGDKDYAPYEGPEPRPSNIPAEILPTTTWDEWIETGEELRLIDWGESFSVDSTRDKLAQPPSLMSPETFFIGSFDYRHDVWRTGCVIYVFFYQIYPFSFLTKGSMVRSMIRTLGPLPPKWYAKWETLAKDDKWAVFTDDDMGASYISNTFEARRQEIINITSQDARYAKSEITEDDYEALKHLLGVMHGLLQYEPDRRISLREAASLIQWTDPWLQGEDTYPTTE